VPSSVPYTAPARSTFRQKLGPGGGGPRVLALGGALLRRGLPGLHRLGAVRKVAEGEAEASADAILVLGRRLDQDRPSPVFEARLAHAERLWREGLAPRIIVAGGLTGRATRTEAEVGVAWLAARGVDPAALHAEDRSQHTLENLFFVREHLRAEGWDRLLLVSDPLHLARASALARGLGLAVVCVPAQGCPPAKHSAAWWRRAVTEAFLLHWYHTGMAYSRIIGSRQQLERLT